MDDSAHIPPLRAYRDKHNLTQDALARAIGVGRTTVARWETGARRIDVDQVEAIAKLTGIPAAQLRPDLAQLLEMSSA